MVDHKLLQRNPTITPLSQGGDGHLIFFMNQKIIINEACMQNFRNLPQKLMIYTDTKNFVLFWPVNSISGQEKGQIWISIAETDSLGSITYV